MCRRSGRSSVSASRTFRSPSIITVFCVLYLCSISEPGEAQCENRRMLYRQKRGAGNAIVFVSNLSPSSQAGRRRFAPLAKYRGPTTLLN
jgi:hypothetical protein